jgi:hypothetical protein
MSYEYLYPHAEKLKEKPFRADEVMRRIEAMGLKPVVVTVDNVRGSLVVSFPSELNKRDKRTLDEGISELLKKW